MTAEDNNDGPQVFMSSPQFEYRKQAQQIVKEVYGDANEDSFNALIREGQFKAKIKDRMMQEYKKIAAEARNQPNELLKNMMNAKSVQQLIKNFNDEKGRKAMNLFHDVQIYQVAIKNFDSLHSIVMN